MKFSNDLVKYINKELTRTNVYWKKMFSLFLQRKLKRIILTKQEQRPKKTGDSAIICSSRRKLEIEDRDIVIDKSK